MTKVSEQAFILFHKLTEREESSGWKQDDARQMAGSYMVSYLGTIIDGLPKKYREMILNDMADLVKLVEADTKVK